MAEFDTFDEEPSFDDDTTTPRMGQHRDESPLPTSDDASVDLSAMDLEEAYLRALDAMETSEWAIGEEESEGVEEEEAEDADLEPTSDLQLDHDPAPGITDSMAGTEIASSDFLGSAPTNDQPAPAPASPETSGSIKPAKPEPIAPSPAPHVTLNRIVEACLFVGGPPLPAKKLANVLEGNHDPADVERLIDELNLEYSSQGRPYEIRLGDGGYRLTLRAEFDVVRNRVYGMGPRDVKLSQDVLEVLALVAYQQPITHAGVEDCKPNSANVLRQLLRRELINLTRIDQTRTGVEYRTTPRFLQLFGLGQLSELPRPEDLSIR